MKAVMKKGETVRLALSLFVGVGLALGLVWALVSQPTAEAQVIAPSGHERLAPREVDTADAAAPAANGVTEPHIRLAKSASYYDAGSVVITQATSLFIDPNEAWTRYQAEELDTIAPPADALDDIKQSTDYSPQLDAYPRPCIYYYGFSHDVAPFDDPRVRGAFAAAIDRPRVISEVAELTGDEFPAVTFVPPGVFGYVDGYAAGIGRPYSPTLAQDLLADSGYAGTPTITLAFNSDPTHQAIAEAARQMWIDTLGVTVTLEAMDWNSYLDLLQNGTAEERPGIWRLGWCSDYADAHNLHSVFSGSNNARYDNPTYDAIVEAAAAETDPAARLALYEEAEATLVMTDTAIAPLYHFVNHRLTREDLIRTYRPSGGQHLDDWDFTGELRPVEVAWGPPGTLDPALGRNDYIEQLFLGLTDVDTDGNAVPELATGWEASDDAMVYTFTMRSDAVWTDDTPVTAYDVEYGVLRSLDPATGSGYAYVLHIIENAQAYNQGYLGDPSQVGVHALNPTQVRFTLERPAAYFPVIASLPPARPQPQWAIEAHGCGWTAPENIVSNGPYELEAWVGEPYLRIQKYAHGNPMTGGTLLFHIDYRNGGADAAEDTVITDTMISGLTYISDTAPVDPMGSGTSGDPLVWTLGTLPAHSCGEFDVAAEVTGSPGTGAHNRVEIATGDPDDQGETWEKESEWYGEIEGTAMMAHYGHDRASGVYPVGHTVWITVRDDVGAVKATATAVSEPGGSGPDWGGSDGFAVEGEDWSPPVDIVPDDSVHFEVDDGYTNTIQVGTIDGALDAEADTAAGTITVPWFAEQTLHGRAGSWGFTWESFEVTLDATGAGDYFVDFSPDDLQPDWAIDVSYTEPDGDRVGNLIRSLDLVMQVNYAHDWVAGNYEPGHTVWLTVTDEVDQVQATVELETQEIPWWGGQTGFSTNLEGATWDPEQPDIQEDWRVYGRVDNGYTATVQIGAITGDLDVEGNTISGNIYAGWFDEPLLNGWCNVWEEGGPNIEFQFDPAGGAYSCDFGAAGWDLMPGQQVGVTYEEPDHDQVINVFESPWMRVNYGDDRVGATYEAGHTFWITVTDAAGTPKGYAEVESVPGGGWGGDGFETNDEDWLTDRPDILPGDWVHAEADDGYTHSVEVGEITGNLNMAANTVQGTITADFSEMLYVRCEVWVENGPNGIDTTAEPDGGSYVCDFDDVGWDLEPGQTVSVRYREPDDGDAVINTFREPVPDMRIEKWAEGSDQVLPDGPVVFTLRYRNEGDALAEAFILTDTLPADTTYVTDTSGVTPDAVGGQVVWTLGPLEPGEEGQFQLVLDNSANPGDVLTNQADIWTEYDDNAWNDHAEAEATVVSDGAPDLYVNKDPSPGDPASGETMLWQIQYGNNGPVTSGPVVLTDTLPIGTSVEEWYSESGYDLWVVQSTGGQLILEAPALPGNWGDRINLRLRLGELEVGTQLTNTVEITTAGDSNPDDNWHMRNDVWVNDPRWNVGLSKEFGAGQLTPGGEIPYHLWVQNQGNMATNVVLTDTLPVGTMLSEAEMCSGWTCEPFPPDYEDGDIAVWDLGLMEPGEGVGLIIRLDIEGDVEPGTVLTNCAEVAIDGDDNWPADNTACVVETVHDFGPNLRIEKDFQWNGEGQLEYTIDFKNLGSTVLSDVVITDTPPSDTSFNGNWGHDFWEEVTFDQVGDQLVWTISRLEPSWQSRLYYQVDLDGALVGDEGLCFTNVAEAPIPEDVWSDDNVAEVTACTGPDVYAEKWVSGGEPRPGEILTFTVEFGNQSRWPWEADDQYGSHITETLPAGMSFLAATTPDDPGQAWEPELIDGNTIVWDFGTMWSNSWWRFDLVVELDAQLEGGDILVNRVEAQGDSPDDVDPNEANNVFELPLTVLAPNFTVDKGYESSRVAGTPITYTLAVVNLGTEAGTNVVLTDTVPTSLSDIATDGYYDGADITWALGTLEADGGIGSGWFSGVLPCSGTVTNDAYGVVSDDGVTAAGTPVAVDVLAPAIVADFDYAPEPAYVLVGESVAFTDTSTTDGSAIVTWEWDFGDGETGSGKTVSHAYSSPGTYTVELTVTDGCDYSDEEIKTDIIVVSSGCTELTNVTFTYTPSDPLVQSPVRYTATHSPADATGPINYTWDFGDGTTTSGTAASVEHVYTDSGTYEVEVTAYNSCTPEGVTNSESVTVALRHIFLPLVVREQ